MLKTPVSSENSKIRIQSNGLAPDLGLRNTYAMNAILRSIAVVSMLLFMPLCAFAAERLTVFAAASLKDALDDSADIWGGEIVISYGGSGLIARQVAQGAPADLVILANEDWMDWLQDESTLPIFERTNLISNRLAVVASVGAPSLTAQDLVGALRDGRLAVGNTRGVPAGIYAKQWLENVGLWADLKGRLAETENVRAALALVSRREAPFGVVYASDAHADEGVVVVFDVPESAHDPIRYPMAQLNDDPETTDFARFLKSDAGQQIFREHGFSALGDQL